MRASRRKRLKAIEALDPREDLAAIVRLSGELTFAWDNQRAMELAFFRTFAVPSIAELLDASGEFYRRTSKRTADTALLIAEFVEHGFDSERGRRAIRRMNQIHSRFDIANADYLYVMGTFVIEPMRFNARFGWRPLAEVEREAAFYFWQRVGQMMGLRAIPNTIEELEAFYDDYESRHFAYTHAGHRLACATRDSYLAQWLPEALMPLGRELVHALCDAPLRRALGLPEARPQITRLVEGLLRARAFSQRQLPARATPYRLTDRGMPRVYPSGYRIEDLGPDLWPGLDPGYLKR